MHIPSTEIKRLTALANRLVQCPPLAKQAVCQAIREYDLLPEPESFDLPTAFLMSILTEKVAWAYAASYRKTRERFPDGPAGLNAHECEAFLLCAPGGISFAQASAVLRIPADIVQTRYASACDKLGKSAMKPASINRMRLNLLAPPQKKAPSVPPKWAAAAIGCALLDVTAIATAATIFFWSRDFLHPPAPPAASVSSSHELLESAPSLDRLFYSLTTIPSGFWRTGHTRSANFAQDSYSNAAGDTIVFSQQISPDLVTGFSSGTSFEPVSFRGHPAALIAADGQQQVFWFNEYYCYTLSTNLPQETALELAQGARISGTDGTGQEISLRVLPKRYTQRLALENGDILLGTPAPVDMDRIEKFIQCQESGSTDAIRISQFLEDGTVRITDLETENGRVYYTLDTSRARTSGPQETGAVYHSARLAEADGLFSLLLESDGWDEPLTAVSWDSHGKTI